MPFASLHRRGVQLVCQRHQSVHGIRGYQALQAVEHGQPVDVLRVQELELPRPEAGEAVVDILRVSLWYPISWLHLLGACMASARRCAPVSVGGSTQAPLNPSDINQIQGVYPLRAPLPFVAGNEGVCSVHLQEPEVSSNSGRTHLNCLFLTCVQLPDCTVGRLERWRPSSAAASVHGHLEAAGSVQAAGPVAGASWNFSRCCSHHEHQVSSESSSRTCRCNANGTTRLQSTPQNSSIEDQPPQCAGPILPSSHL